MSPRIRTAVAAAAALAALTLTACTPEQGREFQAINGVRRTEGVPGPELQWSEEAGDIAQAYANLLTDGRPLAHNPVLAEQLNGTSLDWLSAGENVGCGSGQLTVFTAYLFSPTHHHNILARAWDVAGTGVSTRGDKTCTVQVFVDLG